MNQPINALGYLLRELRTKRDKSQMEVARELGIKQPNYCRYETGKSVPNRRNFAKLAKYFGYNEEEFRETYNRTKLRPRNQTNFPLIESYFDLIKKKYSNATEDAEREEIREGLEKMVEPKKIIDSYAQNL